MIQFYIPDIAARPLLEGEEAGHALRVLRKGAGDEIIATDGHGKRYACRIAEAGKREAKLEIIEEIPVAKPWRGHITLAVAPTKNIDRTEWLVEKAVEIGIDRLVFLECEHSERRRINEDRIRKIMVSAMKQSLKAELPQLDVMVPLAGFLKDACAGSSLYIAYCIDRSQSLLFPSALMDEDPGGSIVLLIGPEGDFSKAEVDAALAAGARCVTFGDSRLRTETAALFGLSQIHTVKQLKYNIQ